MKKYYKGIFNGFLLLAIFLMFLGFRVFGSGGPFLNIKIILAWVIIACLFVISLATDKPKKTGIVKKDLK